MSHTPGPWRVGGVTQDHDCKMCPIFAGSDRIAQVLGGANTYEVEDWNEEDMANARLIAAAPDLLMACKVALKRIGVDGCTVGRFERDALDRIEAAIAKAEGR